MQQSGFVLSCATVAWFMVGVSGCAAGPDTGCQGGLDAEQCLAHCKRFTTCGECAAQPSCGWCAAEPGSSGSCVPALSGEDRRNVRPDSRCELAWFYRPADEQVPPAAPFCPAVEAPGSEVEK